MPPTRAPGPSLALRAFMAVALTVSFYAFAIGLAVLLLLVPWFQWREDHHLSIRLALFCIVGGGAILWGVLPRFEKFVSPGPRLTEKTQPRLFKILRSVAGDAGQEMPAEVYLVPDLNAGVLQRGGLLGFGGRRVMVLGLPLLSALRVTEFRAVLAHEFGHYLGGETRLGPWIYRTREAIGRTIRTLTEADSLLRFVFEWYGKAFLLITHAISRRQELAADRLGAEVAGAPALAGGLRRIHGADPAYQAFFEQEMAPVLSAGFRPPVADGFVRFLRSEPVSTAVEGIEKKMARERKGDAYDTHPPLGERLAALGNPGPEEPGPGNPRAISLLDGLDGLEKALLKAMLPGMPADIEPMAWEEAGEKVFLPAWREAIRKERDLLGATTAAGLAAALAPAPEARRRHRLSKGAGDEERKPSKLAGIAGCALCVLLADRGWDLACEPGAPISLSEGAVTVRPFTEVDDLAAGKTEPAAWEARVRALGIADVRLDTVAGKEPPQSSSLPR